MQTGYRTVTAAGVDVFYREAGPSDAPAVLLLHGFPSRRGCGSRCSTGSVTATG